MATSKSYDTKQLLIQEASDPDTDSDRLRQLAEDYALLRFVAKNPSVPEDVWRRTVLTNHLPQAWDNPMAPIYLIAWTPRSGDMETLEEAAVEATGELFRDPTACSTQGKVLLAAKVQEWWETTENAKDMMLLLGRWARTKGRKSPEHRKLVRILVECARTAPDLTNKDNEALDLLEAWAEGGEDRRYEAEVLVTSSVVNGVVTFAYDLSSENFVINETLRELSSGKSAAERKELVANHLRKFANIIRRQMPLPPRVD